jgi:alpha-glucosidase
MIKRYSYIALCLLLALPVVICAQAKSYKLTSPDEGLTIEIAAGKQLTWSIIYQHQQIITPSIIALKMADGNTWGGDVKVSSAVMTLVNTPFEAINYRKKWISNNYRQLTLNCKGGYTVVFRVYNDGAAYRFEANTMGEHRVASEEANFNFSKDYLAFLPYVRDLRKSGDQTMSSFEALYDERKLSGLLKDSLAFLPLVINLDNGVKAGILEAGLENYPGMFITKSSSNPFSLKGSFAAYPLKDIPGGYNFLNAIVTERANYIAKVADKQTFPWRVVVVAPDDKSLLGNDMVQRLAAPPRLTDVSWIKPGKVSWDWWNDWNISHVDFRAGINTETYKYYIDFAAENHLEYIIMDEGWSDARDLLKISPKVALQEIIDYGRQKNVNVILWASWRAVHKDMEAAFSKYSAMGIKGFKIDFLDRNDQEMTSSTYLIAATAAKYKLMVDYHGVYAPDGLQRTYPNVINYEGVKGLENSKWTPADDVPQYDTTLPFIRMLAGPMDYTPGAMRNAIKANFRPSNSNPMSQGTRCHQLAMYVVFDAPLQMLADNPTIYKKEQECTTFISKIPTTFDELVPLDSKIGQYVALAKSKNNVWYVGAMSNWNARDLEVNLSFLPAGAYEAEIFKDGINADRDATDYKREVISVSKDQKISVHLSNGGGWAARIYPVK